MNGFATEAVRTRLRKRRAAERRFRFYGRAAIIFAVVALAWLLISILSTGLSAFTQHWITLEIDITTETNAGSGEDNLPNYRQSLALALTETFDTDTDLATRRELLQIISAPAATEQIRVSVNQTHTQTAGRIELTVPASDITDQFLKGHINPDSPQSQRKITDRQIGWIMQMQNQGQIDRRFNHGLFLNPDSRNSERAGLASAILGSVMILLIASVIALPVGVGAAIYLDSFAPRSGWRGWLTRAVEVNINNLAAVPPIVFGLLGLAIFITLFGLPRSIPLVGGLVLALRMFPTIVIASRAALQAVPETLTDSALSLGASRMQAVFGQKLPVAVPGILTGSIIGIAQALGETAPLLMIGMVAFVTAVPQGPMDPASALPVQIFLWSGSAEAAWAERTSAAIIALLVILMTMNAAAIILRERLQRRKGG